MAEGLLCPNPTCSHEFSADAVKGVATLSCPRCGAVFQFRTGPVATPPQPTAPIPALAITPAPASSPIPWPPAPPPTASPPSPPEIPLATPVAPAPPSPAASSEPSAALAEILAPPADFAARSRSRVSGRAKAKRSPWRTWILVAVVLLLLVGTTLGLWYAGKLDQFFPEQDEFVAGGEYTSPHLNYRFQMPAHGWRQDKATGEHTPKVQLQAPITLRHTGPSSWMTLTVDRNDKRTPAEAELLDQGVARLRAYFNELEFELMTERLGKPLVLGGHPAVRIVFRARVGEEMMTGECFMVAHQGIAYWLTTWAPETDAEVIFEEWERLRDGFAILKDRDDWQENKPRQFALAGTKASYGLSCTEGLWEKRPATDYDSDADAALHGRDETEPRHAGRTATALVLVLPAAEDLKAAVAAARMHLENRHKAEYPESTFEDVVTKPAGSPGGPPDEIGDSPGRILKIRVKNGESRERFVYLGVVQLPEQVLMIQCECDWRRKDYWNVNFVNLVRTLRIKR